MTNYLLLQKMEFNRLLSQIQKKPLYWCCLLISSAAYAIHQILTSFVNMYLLNAIIEQEVRQLFIAFTMLGIALFLSCVVDPIVTYNFKYCTSITVYKMKIKLFNHIQHLPMQYVDGIHAGDLQTRFSSDIAAMERLFGQQLYSLILAILYGMGSFISMIALDWRLAIITTTLGIISTSLNMIFTPRLRKASIEVQSNLSKLIHLSRDEFNGIRNIKMFCLQKVMSDRFENQCNDLAKCEMEAGAISSNVAALNFIVSAINMVGVFAVGTYMVTLDIIDFGTLIAVIGLQGGVSFMFRQVGKYMVLIQSSLVSAMRIFEVMDVCVEDSTYKTVSGSSDVSKSIELQNVSFAYNGKDYVLKNVSMSLEKGRTVAFVGESGGGKSTLLKLLMGFYRPQTGFIYINGALLDEENVVANISYVPQNAFLFDATIEENIRYGKLSATTEEIVDAAKKANAHDFIMELLNGYNTKVGEGGSHLSGGQKQRIAIARAFLKDSSIIILDEPTSSLDSLSEKLVKDALNTLVEGKTVLIVAHQMSTIEQTDTTFVLRNGNLECAFSNQIFL